MAAPRKPNIIIHFDDMEDPRRLASVKFPLPDLVFLCITAVLVGAESCVDIASFAKAKRSWFQRFGCFRDGTPSHDTIRRILSLISPRAFERCFRSWVASVFVRQEGEVIAIDGKSLRGSKNLAKDIGPIHLVSAWACRQGLTLGQVKVDDKSNEITAVPKLLEDLVIEGCVVTMDAMGCQKKLAEQIRDQKGDYLLALKANQGKLFEDVEAFFKECDEAEFDVIPHSYSESTSRGHGREEIRRIWAVEADEWIQLADEWCDLKTVVRIESTRKIGNEVSVEYRYYITSMACEAEKIGAVVRDHWKVENELHWVLDVIFTEDGSQIRERTCAQNFSVLRRLTLCLLKQDKSKGSLKGKRKQAGWDEGFLEALLALNC